MKHPALIRSFELGFPWQTRDPFLFCVYHQDFYPAGNPDLGPAASLQGRQIGQDFVIQDGWRMYHGQKIPGFPGHPHRGFETVTVVRQGWVDHADSLGAAGRYGAGDVQWMTAGRGIQHAEMFPLLHADRANPLELFQIWLNLPRSRKMVNPHFSMFWAEDQVSHEESDHQGRKIHIELIAGSLKGFQAPAPPPDSWAADPDHHVAIWLITLEAEAEWLLPAATAGLNRSLYYYQGQGCQLSEQRFSPGYGLELHADQPLSLHNGPAESRFLLLQGRPIGEPVMQYGPFVMNTKAEIIQAFEDYEATRFGGWPWPSHEPVHGTELQRFACYPDGRRESPQSSSRP